MSESNELKKIKKIYGENFMHFCREMFPTILEEEGKLYSILTSLFAENCKTLYEDIKRNKLETEFKNEIYGLAFENNGKKNIVNSQKTPFELLDEAGYDLYECTTQDEILSFKKYYKENEELCTFRDDRLNRCVVFFAVRKDVDKIRREDFRNPWREDEYGTSVMSIQFAKQGVCTCSIKNRYNHTVNNPDATYGNNLDRIIPGLSSSFENLLKQRGLSLDTSNVADFELPNYVKAYDGKYYKYNLEDMDVYYCPGNIIIRYGHAYKIENPEKNILIDNYIVDIENKEIRLALGSGNLEDEFIKSLDCDHIKSIKVEKDREKGNGCRKITIDYYINYYIEEPSIIEINKNNQITGFTNTRIRGISQEFLPDSEALENLSLPNLIMIENYRGFSLRHIYFPSVEYIGNGFLFNNEKIKELNLPKLRRVASSFGTYSKVEKAYFPLLNRVGESFLAQCKNLRELYSPELERVYSNFCTETKIEEVILPKIREVGDDFLADSSVQRLYAPLLRRAGSTFLYGTNIENLNLPELQIILLDGINHMERLTSIYLPKLFAVGESFFYKNNRIENAYFPELKEVSDFCFNENLHLKSLGLPKTTGIGPNSINNCQDLEIVNAPNLQILGYSSLEGLPSIKIVGMPALSSEFRPIIMDEFPDTVINAESSKKIDGFLRNQYRKMMISSSDIASLDKNKKMTQDEVNSAGNNLVEEEKFKNSGEK